MAAPTKGKGGLIKNFLLALDGVSGARKMKKFEQPTQKGKGETRAWLQQIFGGNTVLLNSQQVSRVLGISNQTFRNWIWQKKFTLEPVRAGGPSSRPRWRLDQLADYLDQCRQTSRARRGRPKKSLPSPSQG